MNNMEKWPILLPLILNCHILNDCEGNRQMYLKHKKYKIKIEAGLTYRGKFEH